MLDGPISYESGRLEGAASKCRNPSKVAEMERAKALSLCLVLFIFVSLLSLAGCARPEQPAVEPASTPEAVAPPDPLPPASPPDLSKPRPEEVQAKVNSIYQGTVTVDSGREQYFIVGDFNGDAYQDLAVVVNAVDAKLDDLNSEIANWIRDEPLKSVLASPLVLLHKMPSDVKVQILRGDTLLAIIHGYGPDGWRNKEATQTYLLRGAAGNGMKVELRKDLLVAARKGAKIPSIKGDFLSETLGGRNGYVYYNGAHYVWFDPKSYKEEKPAELPAAHPPVRR